MAVSRFTAAKSADRRTAAIAPNAVAGSASRRAVRPAKFTSPAKASVILPAARTAPPCLPASTASTPDTTATTRRITTSPAYGCPRGRRPPAPPPPGSHDRACAARLPSSRSATPHRLDGRPQVASTDGVTLSDRQAYGERPPSKLSKGSPFNRSSHKILITADRQTTASCTECLFSPLKWRARSYLSPQGC